MIDFRYGRYQDVLGDVECDALICDPPYSERTHTGQRTGSEIRKSTITYPSITREDADELAAFWSKRTRYCAVIFGDHVSYRWHQEAWESCGWYTFAPVYWLKQNTTPRMSGDGPTTSAECILVARRKARLPHARMGSRPGHYLFPTDTGGDINSVTGKSYPGRKTIPLMKALVLDYTLKGDLICDSHTGLATTLIAAEQLGRNSVGSECVEAAYRGGSLKIKSGITGDMFAV